MGASKVLQDIYLKRKAALVTGAGRGIGREIAFQMAQRGADIAVVDVEHETAGKAAREIGELGVKAKAYNCDVSSLSAVERVTEAVSRDFEHIDILVNNAGITRDRLLVRMTREDWDVVVSVNMTGAFNFCKVFGPEMLKRRSGNIVKIASVIGQWGTRVRRTTRPAKPD